MTALRKPKDAGDYVSATVYDGVRKLTPAQRDAHRAKLMAAVKAKLASKSKAK